MLFFKPIELEDKKEVDSCLANNTYRACDYCFTNIYVWKAKFKTHFAIFKKTLFIRFQDEDNRFFYMMPIGKMRLQDSFALLLEDAERQNEPFAMKGVTRRMWDDIQACFPDKFSCEHDQNNDEYIYLSERLIELKGRKLQSKRNHINRFKREYSDWTYFPLTRKEDLDECSVMHRQWDIENEDKMETGLLYDQIATQKMLDNFDLLNLTGAAIRVNGKIVAFTIGEPLTEDTFVVHAEKAFSNVNGAYSIMNQQFVEHEARSFKYINREEDLGIESLRRAKQSYCPDILLEEKILTLKDNSRI